MENKSQLLLFFSIVILSISLIIASKSISEAISDIGQNLGNSTTIISSDEKYELIVNDGWIYLYDTNSGEIYKKEDNPDSTWEKVIDYYSVYE